MKFAPSLGHPMASGGPTLGVSGLRVCAEEGRDFVGAAIEWLWDAKGSRLPVWRVGAGLRRVQGFRPP